MIGVRFVAALLLPLVAGSSMRPPYRCFDFDVPLSFKALTIEFDFPEFQNHYESVAFLSAITSRTASAPPIKGINPETEISVVVSAEYCTPGTHTNGIVQILTHGLGFDKSYWSFGGFDSQYNYVKVATAAGYSTLAYDRIGTGKSTKSNPYTINQLQVEMEVLKALTERLRNKDIPALRRVPKPNKIVHVGHSFGSQLSSALVAKYPTISDGIILTGFSMNASAALIISSNFQLAKEADPTRFSDLSSGYLTWADELSNQYSFLHYPNFDPAVLAKSEATKWPFTIGEALTLSVTDIAPLYKGPVLVRVPSSSLIDPALANNSH